MGPPPGGCSFPDVIEVGVMVYFSRLTDIVTANLSEMLAKESDPVAALKNIVNEMIEGLAGAKRSVATASLSEERLRREIGEHQQQAAEWTAAARRELTAGREKDARLALERKQEVLDVVAGLEQQHKAAIVTRDHLATTLRALEARLAEARRRMRDLDSVPAGESGRRGGLGADSSLSGDAAERTKRIDEELEALKRETGKG
ncbi:MAG: PspA/IM30 family protein [Planctomycetaceae bacterium]